MDMLGKMMAYEQGDLSDDEIVELFQELVNKGIIRHLQGSYGRTARVLVDAGLVTVPVRLA